MEKSVAPSDGKTGRGCEDPASLRGHSPCTTVALRVPMSDSDLVPIHLTAAHAARRPSPSHPREKACISATSATWSGDITPCGFRMPIQLASMFAGRLLCERYKREGVAGVVTPSNAARRIVLNAVAPDEPTVLAAGRRPRGVAMSRGKVKRTHYGAVAQSSRTSRGPLAAEAGSGLTASTISASSRVARAFRRQRQRGRRRTNPFLHSTGARGIAVGPRNRASF